MQKGRVMLRAAGGIPYELTRGRVKRLNLHVRRDGTVALSIPLRTTLEQWRAGAWPFVYHVVGNLTWFMPLGLYLHARGWDFAACALAGLLLSLLIECAQFVLGCGISEIDDLLLNTLGAMAGYACLPLARLVSGKHEK